jgi:hypothetical protein
VLDRNGQAEVLTSKGSHKVPWSLCSNKAPTSATSKYLLAHSAIESVHPRRLNTQCLLTPLTDGPPNMDAGGYT